MNQSVTDFLAATTTYLTGAASAFGLGGNFYAYNVSHTPEEADARAIRNDFAMVAQDYRRAFKKLQGDCKEQLELKLDA